MKICIQQLYWINFSSLCLSHVPKAESLIG